ncbi:MAG TPA: SSI family serine proteinase inhibitor [Propionibacteriaceae bacterium]
MAGVAHSRAGLSLLLGAASLVLVVGCGNPSAGPTAPSPGATVTPSDSPSQAAADTELTIVSVDGSGASTTWLLSCDPAGGDHPDAAAACAALDKFGAQALPPVPKDQMCTQIYGGSETATVTGRWRGANVMSTFSRNNGCEIARWKMLTGLLPEAGS